MTEQIEHKFSFSQNDTGVRVYHAHKGSGIPKHEHAYSHITLCVAGSIAVRKEGIEKVFTKDSQPVNLVANEWHEIEALEDGTIFINIFAENKY